MHESIQGCAKGSTDGGKGVLEKEREKAAYDVGEPKTEWGSESRGRIL